MTIGNNCSHNENDVFKKLIDCIIDKLPLQEESDKVSESNNRISVIYDYAFPYFYIDKISIKVEEIKKIKIIFKDNTEKEYDVFLEKCQCNDGEISINYLEPYVIDEFRGVEIKLRLSKLILDGCSVLLI